VPEPASTAHVSAGFHGIFHPCHRIRLDVEIRVGVRLDREAFFLTARINPDGDFLAYAVFTV
jgi:hypothetical protein